MSQRPRIRRTALTVIAVCALTTSTAPVAVAGTGDWTQVSQTSSATAYPEITNTAQPTVARFGSTLQVLWPQQMSSSAESYLTAVLDASGRITTPPTVAIADWSTLTSDPTITTVGGQRFLTFSGLASGRSGAQYFATSGDGLAWAVSDGSLSETQSAYAGYGSDLVDNAGTPVWVGNPGTTSGVTWHVGISPSNPAPAGSDQRFQLGGCCAYSAAVARDAATGAVYTAFYSNSSATTENGIQIGQILPAQGAFAQAPGSVTVRDGSADSVSPDQRVAMAARAGGGVFVAYAVGYPSAKLIRILNVTSAAALDVPVSGNVRDISLGADPAGRLWLAWNQSNSLRAVHTNPAGTVLGAVGAWGAPRGTDSMWKTAISPSATGADAIVTATTKSAINVWHAQLLRTLSVKAAPASARRGGTVAFTVTDAGAPVAGATVLFSGRSATTNGSGRVTMGAPRSSGVAKASARKTGFNPGGTAVRVR